MRYLFLLIALLLCGFLQMAHALSADEVIKLKEAGVSDQLIQTMIEQENNPNKYDGSGVWESKDQIIYQAAPRQKTTQDRHDHEAWKERKSMDALENVVIDGRRPLPDSQPPRHSESK